MKKSTPKYNIYKGSGNLDKFVEISSIDDTKGYIPNRELINAVNVAILLGKPLLVTGEPGTGKTLLAKSIAEDVQSKNKNLPFLEFVAKTTSDARDLLYRYDSIGHFRDANKGRVVSKGVEKEETETEKLARRKKEYAPYIKLEALGEAIRIAQEEQRRAVVLIDEIDKAPRDFPNDILREIESLTFKIIETGEIMKAPRAYKPIVIITSNSERLLPDAFLRRCIFYHISFPDAVLLKEIVNNRLQRYREGSEVKSMRFTDAEVEWLISHFQQVRELCRKKKPATAELLSWVHLLDKLEFQLPSPSAEFTDLEKVAKDLLLTSYSVLAKHIEDFDALRINLDPNQTRNEN